MCMQYTHTLTDRQTNRQYLKVVLVHVCDYVCCSCRGWEQLEVSCNPKASDPNNLWNVEGNINDKRKCDYNE